MAGPAYYCIHRNVNTTASGSHTAPAGCINGRFDFTAQRNGIPGNCTGIFMERPKCEAFHPSDETPAGQRFWARKKAQPEKPFALPVRSSFTDAASLPTYRISDAAVNSVLAKVRAGREEMLELIR